MCKYNLLSVILAIMSLNNYICETKAFRTIVTNGVETIFALEKEMVNMECKAETQMRYCGFIHPSGKRYSFTGQTTYDGKCSVKINATVNDTGTWRCHIGSRSAGVEVLKFIQLRVVGPIAAVQRNITSERGEPITLYCTTIKGLVPISYCRFEPPNSEPFSIDSSVTQSHPLLKRFYFPNNKSLDRGDCAVTIRKVRSEDHGTWTCGAGLNDGNEYIDFITIEVEGLYSMTKATATRITLGVLGIVGLLILLGICAWKNKTLLGSIGRREQTAETCELAPLPPRATSSRPTTPQLRNIPSVVVESPSDSSDPGTSSQLTTSPLIH